MILSLGGLLIGAILGALAARRRGGTTPDILQWAAVGGIVLGLIGLFVAIFLARASL